MTTIFSVVMLIDTDQTERGGHCWPPLSRETCGALTFDRVDRTGINTSAAIGAGVSINNVHVALFADCINRAAVYTSGAINTLVSNCVSHDITSFFYYLSSLNLIFAKSYPSSSTLSTANKRYEKS
jgi:hypothetical protein